MTHWRQEVWASTPKAIGVMVAVSPSSGGAVGVLGAIGTVTLASLYALWVSLTRTVNWSTVFGPACLAG